MGDNLPFIDLGYNVKAVQVECYQSSVCVMTMDGRMKCWGRNCGDDIGKNGKGSVLPYNNRGGDGGADLASCKDKGADWSTMGEYLPYVNVDCADKANAELQTVWAHLQHCNRIRSFCKLLLAKQ
ncbi:hypothetical protein T484DRAFT_1866854 [Baffinella frigidus]|nr:hypothetical protein T484DRAFT_1866854 [Cryptophyta sp. CCMP2293]